MANHRRDRRDEGHFFGQNRPNSSFAPYYSDGQRNRERYGDNTFGRPYGQDYPYTERNYNQEHSYPYGTGSRAQSNYRGGTYEGGYSNPDYRHADDYRQSPGYDFRHQRESDHGYYGNDDRNASSNWPESNQARFWERQGSDRHGGQHRGKGPKGYIRSDERIKEDISDRLSDHDDIDASEIEVTVNKGEVVLSGTVNDRYEKRIAEECAEQVSGVTNVENRIRLQQQGSSFDNIGRASASRPAFGSERAWPKNQAMNES